MNNTKTQCNLDGCEKTKGLLKCSRCLTVSYCGKQHQKDDWERHKSGECITAKERQDVMHTEFCVSALSVWFNEKRERKEMALRYMQEHECFGRVGVLYLSIANAHKAEDLMDGKIDWNDPSIQITFIDEDVDTEKWLRACKVQYNSKVNFAYIYRVALPKGGWKQIQGIAPRPEGESPISLILRATVFAAHVHRFKTRKSDKSSYICHPLEVSDFLHDRANVSDAEVLVAAILHDTVEDHPEEASKEIIREKFGDRVANIVAEVTDDRSLSQVERKRAQLKHVQGFLRDGKMVTMSREAKLVKAADIWHNLSSMRKKPPEGWDDKKINGYVAWKKLIFDKGLRLLHPEIERELKELFSVLLTPEICNDLEKYVESYFDHLSS